MIDGGELKWKIVAIFMVRDADDFEKHFPVILLINVN